MPGADIAQYGLATFAVAGLIYIVSIFVKQKSDRNVTAVIENNTRVIEQVICVIQNMQINMARQEAKMDELLDRARRE